MPRAHLEIHDTLPSSNDRAIALAEAGAPPWTAVLALDQTAGRGRHGRTWIGGRGNLFLSVLLDGGMVVRPFAWSLIAALATAETVEPLLPDPSCLALKWPNDVLVGGRKLAGILIEAGTSASQGPWTVAGIGMNLVTVPTEAAHLAASLAGLGVVAPDPVRLAGDLIERLAARGEAAARDGYQAVLAAWQGRSAAAGSGVTVRLADEVVQGRYLGLDPDGALLVGLDGGATRRIIAGEVVAGG